MSEKLIIFILLVVYLARPKQLDEIQIRWRNEIRLLLEDELYIRLFIIYVIVSNDDNTIRAVFKHPSKGAQGQVLNSSKGKLENSDRIILLPAFFSLRNLISLQFTSQTTISSFYHFPS